MSDDAEAEAEVWLDTAAVAATLTDAGLPTAPKTLANQRAAGTSKINWKYRGIIPVATKREVSRYLREDAVQSEHPRRRNARDRSQQSEMETA